MDPSTWSYEDLKAFLLIYAANVDLKETPKELRAISHGVSAKRFDELHEFFESNGDYENLQAILSLKQKYYDDPVSVERLLGDMESLFRVDGDYSYIEKVVLTAIRRIL